LHTVRDFVRFGASRFNEAELSFGHGTDDAHDEACYLVLHALHLPPDRLEPYFDSLLLDREKHAVLQLLQARVATRKPAAYLTHEAYLAGYRFLAEEGVIVPRSFIAEMLTQPDRWPIELPAEPRILDLCAGSASLAILAAYRWQDAVIDAVDIDAKALDLAHRNVDLHRLEGQVFPIESDLYTALKGQRYDLIMANPPYVDALAMAELPDEYRAEPELALASGEDGLDHVRRILAAAPQYLNPKGHLWVEIGHQRVAVVAAFPDVPFAWPDTISGNGSVFALRAKDLRKTASAKRGQQRAS
jgi:ribosomal protein L3 glutamine methyltransferase